MAIFKTRRITGTVRKVAFAALALGLALPFSAGAESLSDRVDNMYNSIDELEEKVRSTLLSGGSSPVSFSGEARLRAQYHNLGFEVPGYMSADRSYFQSGWEGNENLFRLGMVVSPSRNTILWSKIGLQHTLIGNRYYEPVDGDFTNVQFRQDKVRNSVTIHEDLSAGIAVRTLPASFWVRLGNTMWTEASPFTVWKAQPRTFAWEYLPFEVEQPIARYYEYNIAKGEKSGRAAWNKKPFNGINVESINLPLDLYANFVYGTFERYDNFEREYIDFAGDLGYADGDGASVFPSKGHGIGDSYRHVIHGRVAKEKMLGNMILGLNYVGIDYNKDALFAAKMDEGSPVYPFITEFRAGDSLFVKEPKTISVDMRGPINDKFSIHADLAVNWTDTLWFIDPISWDRINPETGLPYGEIGQATGRPADLYSARSKRPEWYSKNRISGGDISPAAYLKLNYNGVLPTELDLAYIHPGFYSPFSFVAPVDGFYAFGSNMVGAGKFIARGEGSPYTQNMAGANLTFNPKLAGYGHLRLKYGQHFNVTDEGRDHLFLPYRLNGSDMFSFFHSSYNRWGNGLIDNSVKVNSRTYKARLGDESFVHMASYNTNLNIRPVAGPGAGGLRSDYLSMFESFVPYNDSLEAWRNFRSKHVMTGSAAYAHQYFTPGQDFSNLSTIINHSLYVTDSAGNVVASTNTSWVPTSRKYTFNLELDAAYDIGRFVGYDKDLFVGGYIGINGVTRDNPSVLTLGADGDNTLLWSLYARFEPAIALTKNFYVLGLVGYENWRSEQSWMLVNGPAPIGSNLPYMPMNPTMQWNVNSLNRITPEQFIKVPINYHDVALGIGFDWDMLERVGLHARVKWISHTDAGLNDYYDEVVKKWNADRPDGHNYAITPADKNDWSSWIVSLEVKTWF